jgi:tellurite resistance protein TerC
MNNILAWSIFGVVVLVMLALDLGVFHRQEHEVKMKEALIWSGIWIVVALLFNWGIYLVKGKELAMQFFAGYVLERTLSFDNLFVFLLIFDYFQLPRVHHHRILSLGILGALVMRAGFIGFGIGLLNYFSWMIYVFGAILVWTGAKMAFEKDQKVEPEKNVFLRIFRRMMPISDVYDGSEFFIRKNGLLCATPLMVIIILLASSDVIFAVDSIPAVLAVSKDPFVVYTSNIFAVLGMRALFFALAELMRLFHHLRYGLSLILVLIGIKMLLASFSHVPTSITLGAILSILAASVVASILWPQKSRECKNG